jgi:hypothetical protein
MAKKVSWTSKWPKQDYTGYTDKQIADKKKAYKAKAVNRIETQIQKLGKRITYTTRWTRLRSKPVYYLLTYLTPPATEEGDGGTGQSNISPTPPPKP